MTVDVVSTVLNVVPVDSAHPVGSVELNTVVEVGLRIVHQEIHHARVEHVCGSILSFTVGDGRLGLGSNGCGFSVVVRTTDPASIEVIVRSAIVERDLHVTICARDAKRVEEKVRLAGFAVIISHFGVVEDDIPPCFRLHDHDRGWDTLNSVKTFSSTISHHAIVNRFDVFNGESAGRDAVNPWLVESRFRLSVDLGNDLMTTDSIVLVLLAILPQIKDVILEVLHDRRKLLRKVQGEVGVVDGQRVGVEGTVVQAVRIVRARRINLVGRDERVTSTRGSSGRSVESHLGPPLISVRNGSLVGDLTQSVTHAKRKAFSWDERSPRVTTGARLNVKLLHDPSGLILKEVVYVINSGRGHSFARVLDWIKWKRNRINYSCHSIPPELGRKD